ncbi:MAG: tetratricopeptide repeat protein, partial [Gammaproteobacteria bacterium]
FDEALYFALELLALNKNRAMSYYRIGMIYADLERYDDAIRSMSRAHELEPQDLKYMEAYAQALGYKGLYEKEIEFLESQLRKCRGRVDVKQLHYHLGHACYDTFRFRDALYHYNIAREVLPDFRDDIDWDIAVVHLASGNLMRGWEGYQMRRLCHFSRLDPAIPVWDGEQDIEGKTLLVTAEQGLGDEILFATCLPELQKSGARISLECDERLHPVFRRSFPDIQLLRRDDGASYLCDADYFIPSGSLPILYRQRHEDFPGRLRVLETDITKRQYWKKRLAGLSDKPKVGVMWKSSITGKKRSFSNTNIQNWLPVLSLKGIDYINLQYSDADNDIEWLQTRHNIKLHKFEELDLYNDIDGQLALIDELDLVISICSCVYDFSGALGKETWLLLYRAEWITLGTGKIPWFPSVRICQAVGYTGGQEFQFLRNQLIRKFSLAEKIHPDTAGMKGEI